MGHQSSGLLLLLLGWREVQPRFPSVQSTSGGFRLRLCHLRSHAGLLGLLLLRRAGLLRLLLSILNRRALLLGILWLLLLLLLGMMMSSMMLLLLLLLLLLLWLLLLLLRMRRGKIVGIMRELAVLTVVAPTLAHELETGLPHERSPAIVRTPHRWTASLPACMRVPTRSVVQEATPLTILASPGVPEFEADLWSAMMVAMVSITPVCAGWCTAAHNSPVRGDVCEPAVQTVTTVSRVSEIETDASSPRSIASSMTVRTSSDASPTVTRVPGRITSSGATSGTRTSSVTSRAIPGVSSCSTSAISGRSTVSTRQRSSLHEGIRTGRRSMLRRSTTWGVEEQFRNE